MNLAGTGMPEGAPADPPAPSSRALAHIPRLGGWPIVGDTPGLMADPRRFLEGRSARLGPVFRIAFLGNEHVQLLGPEANERVLHDRDRLFSARLGWEPYFSRLFPRGVISMDFEEHQLHRHLLSVAFRPGPMQAYLAALDAGIAEFLDGWTASGGPHLVYPAMRRLTLALAARTFLGTPGGEETEAVNRAFVAEVAATVGLVRAPLPGTAMGRGVRARAWLVQHLAEQVPRRRQAGGDDLLSQLCRVELDDGELLSPGQIADHMNFLMMAAHDTLTSAFSAFVALLAAHPLWQERLRAEAAAASADRREALRFDQLDAMPLTDMAFKEALRLVPPVPSMPRRALRAFEFGGYVIPAGARVGVWPLVTHHMPAIWPEPDRFDPLRFSEAAQAERHRCAFAPFGGGAHLCLGMHFAQMQARCFTRHLLLRAEVSLPTGYRPHWRMMPMPHPRADLPVVLQAIES